MTGTPPPASGAPAVDAVAGQTAHALALLFTGEPRTLGELAEAIGASEADAAALVAALERHGLLASDPATSTLRAGPAALRLARAGAQREYLLELAAPALDRLARESGETANLIVPRAAGTEAIAQVDGRHVLGATNWLGRELPLHCTAAGKVFLAEGVAQLPEGALSAPAAATITDRDQLRAELEAIRERGYATLVDELEDGLSAVGAPVRRRRRRDRGADRGGGHGPPAPGAPRAAGARGGRAGAGGVGGTGGRGARAVGAPSERSCEGACGPVHRTARISCSNVVMWAATMSRERSGSRARIASERSLCSWTRAGRCGRRSRTRCQIRSDRLK